MAFNQTLFRSPNRGGKMLSEYPDGDAPPLDQGADGLFWENFDVLHQRSPDHPDPIKKNIWYIDLGADPEHSGTLEVPSTDQPFDGDNCAKVTRESDGRIMMIFYNYRWAGNEWYFIRETLFDPNFYNMSGSWEFNKYNRMVIYVMPPPSYSMTDTYGRESLDIGTYLRTTTTPRNNNESNNMHFYHKVRIDGSNGRYIKIILDQHPTHQRSTDSNSDLGNQPDPAGEGKNYFDLMTWFYIQSDSPYADDSVDNVWRVDKISFYEETRQENEDDVYSVIGFYDPATNRLYVSWNRNKNDSVTIHEVRYSFFDIHDIGWSAATVAPNGSITPPGPGGYNSMWYDNSSIAMGANTKIYVAIKPQGSNLFKQIQIDLT